MLTYRYRLTTIFHKLPYIPSSKGQSAVSRRQEKCRGFSLVELLIAMVIVTILGAISVPTFQTFLAQRRLNGAARDMHSHLMAIRMQAVSENQWIALNINNNHQYTLFRDSNKNGTVDTGETLAVKDLHPSYHDVTIATAAGTVVTFYPNGTSSTATICMTGATGLKVKKITLSSNGRVKMKDETSC